MKATWRMRDLRLTVAFILALLFGGSVEPALANPNQPGKLDGKSDESLRLIVEEGRRQVDSQTARFEHVQARAQIVLTVSLVALGFIAGVLTAIPSAPGARQVAGWIVWSLSLVLVVLAVATAAAIIAVRADFDTVDTTQVSAMDDPVLPALAADYSTVVRLGEITVAARVTLLRQATRFLSWGSLAAAASFFISFTS